MIRFESVIINRDIRAKRTHDRDKYSVIGKREKDGEIDFYATRIQVCYIAAREYIIIFF